MKVMVTVSRVCDGVMWDGDVGVHKECWKAIC